MLSGPDPADPPLKREHVLWLAALALFAVFLVLEPLASFTLFGSDTGEYYRLTSDLVSTGHIPTSGYTGWGTAYPDFPGIYLLSGAAAGASGANVLSSLTVVIPAVSALSVLPLFLLFRRLLPHNTIALLGAGFASVFMPRAFSLAHPAPLALGDFFAVAALWMLVEGRRDVRWYLPLALTSGGLIVTHHLSSYFFLVSAVGGLLVLELWRPGSWSPRFPGRELLFFAGFLFVLLAYWFVYAGQFLAILRTGLPFVHTALVVPFELGAMVLLVGIGLLLRWRRSWPRSRPASFRYPPSRSVVRDMAILGGLGLGGALAVTVIPLPGTSGQHSILAAVLFFLPIFVALVFCAGSRRLATAARLGPLTLTWVIALGVSAIASAVIANPELPFARHAEYLVIPLGLLVAVGVGHMVGLWASPRGRPAVVAASLAVVLLFSANAAIVYPPPSDFGGFQEGLTYADAGLWMWVGLAAPPWASVATDHRLSSMVFGFDGNPATWSTTPELFTGSNWSVVAAELNSSDAPHRTIPGGVRPINLVAVDAVMRSGVALDPSQLAAPMSASALHWLGEPPFVPLYENGAEVVYWVDGPVPASP